MDCWGDGTGGYLGNGQFYVSTYGRSAPCAGFVFGLIETLSAEPDLFGS